jgi:hypothetical protein
MFLSVQAAAFAAAALIHAGIPVDGYRHREAMIAEGVIAVVLTVGLVTAMINPGRSRVFSLAAQGFALLGTLVGIFTMVIGIGPQSTFDVMLHAAFIALLITGLVVTARRADGVTARRS